MLLHLFANFIYLRTPSGFLKNPDINHFISIYCSTNCTLKFQWANYTKHNLQNTSSDYILIEAKAATVVDAKKNLKKAKEKLENLLLDYVGADGSKGRLFYDLACHFTTFSLARFESKHSSSSVYQRNPFSQGPEKCWMNVVEIPYVSEQFTGRKLYHAKYIFARENGVLSLIRHETGCCIQLCGDDYDFPTNLCDPYLWVWGSERDLVDKAVNFLNTVIEEHQRRCDCNKGQNSK